MFEQLGFADGAQYVRSFGANTTDNNTTQFHTWQKPKGIRMLYVVLAGSGGGGGGGCSGAAGTARGGGAGGGGACINYFLVPAAFVPDTLYIHIPIGGAGGAADQNGTAGATSYICAVPNYSSTQSILMTSGVAGVAGAGNKGATSGAATAGVGGTLSVELTHYKLGLITMPRLLGGQNGGNGGNATGANGTGVTLLNVCPLTGGAGGGGVGTGDVDKTGGSINAVTASEFPGVIGGQSAGNNGSNGYNYLLKHGYNTGGAGGASNATGAAGKGGDAAPGCGGGGGGGGVTGGAGGRGGDGFCYIICW